MDTHKWIELGSLRTGSIFRTKDGDITAVKTISSYNVGETDSPRIYHVCVQLTSGRYRHFYQGQLVRKLTVQE